MDLKEDAMPRHGRYGATLTIFQASPAARMTRPARCACEDDEVAEFAATLACPLPWWPTARGWSHLRGAVLARLGCAAAAV
jgi:hypothetical protein